MKAAINDTGSGRGYIVRALRAAPRYSGQVIVNSTRMLVAPLRSPGGWLDYTTGLLGGTWLGLVYGFLNILFGRVLRLGNGSSVIFDQAIFNRYSAVSLGPFLFGDNFDEWQHEYGHTIQNRVLGPLYWPAIAVPSVLSAALAPRRHRRFFTERWADAWAVHFW